MLAGVCKMGGEAQAESSITSAAEIHGMGFARIRATSVMMRDGASVITVRLVMPGCCHPQKFALWSSPNSVVRWFANPIMSNELFLILVAVACLLCGPAGVVLALVLFTRQSAMQNRLEELRQKDHSLALLLDGISSKGLQPAAPPTAPPTAQPQVQPTAQLLVQPQNLVSPSLAKPPASEDVLCKGPAAAARPTHLKKPPFSLESAIGIRWFNWLGIVTFLVGVLFFLKYAYDNEWVGPVGRTIIIYLVGLLALAAGSRFRQRGYAFVSNGVSALGFGACYAATYFGSVVYGLEFLPFTAAFGIMCVITVAFVITALRNRSQAMGFLSLLAGYLTPYLLASAADRGEALIGYLTLLGLGAFGIAMRERWRAVNALALVGTYLLLLNWFALHYEPTRLATALTGVSIFALLFVARSAVPALVRRQPGAAEDVAFLLLNAIAAFAFYYRLLAVEHRLALVIGMVFFGACHAVLFCSLVTRVARSAPIAIVNLVLSMAAVTIAIPLQLGLWGIPIAWLIEGAAFTYLGVRLRDPWLRFGGMVAHGIAGVYLLYKVGNFQQEPSPFWNPTCGTSAGFVVALFASAWQNWQLVKGNRSYSFIAVVEAAAGMVFLWVLLSRECYAYFYNLQPFLGEGAALGMTSLSVLWAVYAALLLAVGLFCNLRSLRYGACLIFAVTLFKVFVVDINELQAVYRILAFMTLGVLLVLASFAYTRFARSRTSSEPPKS